MYTKCIILLFSFCVYSTKMHLMVLISRDPGLFDPLIERHKFASFSIHNLIHNNPT